MTLRRTIDWRSLTSIPPSFWRKGSTNQETRKSGNQDLGFGVADYLVPLLLRHRVDHGHSVAQLLDGAGHDDLLLGEPHSAELDAQAPELARVAARGGGVRARHLGHAVEAVEDVARQPDVAGELGVDVDRVEVARRARVAVRQVAVGRDLQLGNPLALVHLSLLARCWSTCRARPRRRPGSRTPTRTRRTGGRPSRTCP